LGCCILSQFYPKTVLGFSEIYLEFFSLALARVIVLAFLLYLRQKEKISFESL